MNLILTSEKCNSAKKISAEGRQRLVNKQRFYLDDEDKTVKTGFWKYDIAGQCYRVHVLDLAEGVYVQGKIKHRTRRDAIATIDIVVAMRNAKRKDNVKWI